MENQENQAAATEPKKGKKKKILFALIGVIAIVITLVISLGGGTESTDNAQLDADIIPIRSSVSGYVKSVHFKDNQLVKKGQLLITIDDTELRTRVAQAEAALANAKANLNAVKSNAKASDLNASAAEFSSETSVESINSAKARLTKVKEDFKRVKSMFAAKAATQAEVDGVTAELAVAQAQYDAALKQQKASFAQSQGVQTQATGQISLIALAEALVKQREAELILAQTQLDYATIEAPCDGVVSKRSVEVGQYITMGQPLCSTIDNSTIWVAANFKETQLEKMRIGQAVEIKIDAYPSMHLTGKLNSFIGATGSKFSLLPPDNATGNFVKIVQRVPVKISIDQLSPAQLKKLFPGLSVYVSVNVK
jgi:membrane fusion protein (multidrug efflux system)